MVEDEEIIRDALGPLLEQEGYEVSFAENGREALRALRGETLPNLIVLDLRMPVMDGWEFRAIQQDDPKLGGIPVLALSADGSAKAAAVSAQGYLRKPVEPKQLLATIERLLLEQKQKVLASRDRGERVASLARLSVAVGSDINTPLAFLKLNLSQSIENLNLSIRAIESPSTSNPAAELERDELLDSLVCISNMLDDCQTGGERIRDTVRELQRLFSQAGAQRRERLNIHEVIDEAIALAWDQLRHRGRLVKRFGGPGPVILGNGVALRQIFQSLLVTVADSIPHGEPLAEILITTRVEGGDGDRELVVELGVSDQGSSRELGSEAIGTGGPTTGRHNGLELFFTRELVLDHGGRMTARSEPGKGTIFRVVLPVPLPDPSSRPAGPAPGAVAKRGRILVIDDEPMIGRVISSALRREHDVLVFERASDALTLLDRREKFDLVLCDIMMPELDGQEFYRQVLQRWPQVAPRIVFMTGGAYGPETAQFVEHIPTRLLAKPFRVDALRRLVAERLAAS